MILYFADRQMNIIGQASTELPDGITIIDDLKTEETDTGVAVFECRLLFDEKTRSKVKAFAKAGNYLLRKHDRADEFYTIIDTEEDTKNQEFYIYAEDAGLDLLNEVVGEFEADKAYPITYYIGMYAFDSGFKIGINEAASLTRKLSWDGEATVTERLASIATQFDNCEISYTFDIEGLIVKNKYINIHKKRGKDIGAQLRLNKDIDRIVTKESIQNLATGLKCRGDIPEDEENPITLIDYEYDDGDFYTQGDRIYSRNALKKWSRYFWNDEPNQIATQEGHIVRTYYYETTEQSTLFAHALSELKKYSEMEVNYEVEISKLPDNIKLGDRINIIDDAGELYVSTRILRLETSVVGQEQRATLGEFLIKNSGISERVKELAANFSELSISAARALAIAQNATTQAESAKANADSALAGSNTALQKAEEAQTVANTATESAQAAQTKANEAQNAVDLVEKDIESLETTVANAEAAAEQAKQAAATAETKASEAQTSATEAKAQANTAETKATEAKTAAENATTKADTAQSTAEQAKSEAETAATTAAAAKADAEQAQKDIDAFGEDLTTLSNTMTADYARKTDLTEATASLQSQITQNAGEISSMVTQITEIDETANDAKTQAEQAQTTASAAQSKADEAAADATAAQTAADEAKTAANNAQTEADNAKTAAETAQSVADQAEKDLEAAKADLATVSGRVDATEEDIAKAQNAVTAAQTAADEAKANATTATQKADEAQAKANTAATDASNAQTKANEAAAAATLAQATADEAKGNAATAQQTADEAKANAESAIATANTAKTNAESAQSKADEAKATATAAQQAADDADAKAQQAAADLATAQQNLANVTSRVDATEADIEAAQADVEAAQTAADTAKANAEAAQATANTAKTNAANAQAAADQAAADAEAAQNAADEAQAAADKAQADVDALAVRVTTAETQITQTAEQIELLATKEELTTTLGGYYTKEETDAAISVSADEINLSVDSKIEEIEIGGRNLYGGTAEFSGESWLNVAAWSDTEELDSIGNKVLSRSHQWTGLSQYITMKAGDSCVLSANVKGDGTATYRFYVTEYDKDMNVLATASPGPEGIAPTSETRLKSTAYTVRNDCLIYFRLENSISGSTLWVSSLKFEKGNKATDWTPAPEDVEQSIEDTANVLNTTISEQSTAVTQNCESIILSALESYTKTGDFEEFKTTVNSTLELLPQQLSLQFEESIASLKAENTALNEQMNIITKYFTFDINGLTIGQVDNPYKVIIDNDRYSMTADGKDVMWIENGEVYTPEMTVSNRINLLGYEITKDTSGKVHCRYIEE